MDNDLDAVTVTGRSCTREDARVVLLGVENAQSVLEGPVPTLILRPAFWVLPEVPIKEMQSVITTVSLSLSLSVS